MRSGQFQAGDPKAQGSSGDHIADGMTVQTDAGGGDQGRSQIPQGSLAWVKSTFSGGDGKGGGGMAAGEAVVRVGVRTLLAHKGLEALREQDTRAEAVEHTQGPIFAVTTIGDEGKADAERQVKDVSTTGGELRRPAGRRVGLSTGKRRPASAASKNTE